MHEEIFDWNEILEKRQIAACMNSEEDELEIMKKDLIENIKNDVDKFMGKLYDNYRDAKNVSEDKCRDLFKHAI